MSSGGALTAALTQTTPVFGLRVWVLIAIGVGVIMAALFIIAIWVSVRRNKKKKKKTSHTPSSSQIPIMSKEIIIDRAGEQSIAKSLHESETPFFAEHGRYTEEGKTSLAHLTMSKSTDPDTLSQCSSLYNIDRAGSSYSGNDGSSGPTRHSSSPYTFPSPLVGLPEFSHLGWGHWFTLRDLEVATNRFSKENIVGEGGYGVVYRGSLINGTEVAVKKILNNVGQAEKEFKVEVETIGHVRHKNLVRLMGYCVEGTYRMLVYEFVNNGNLEQWLHGAMVQHGVLNWENRVKILLGTAKALAYLHEAIEPKVVHRDIKSSNVLIDDEFNSKVSDFGLAKILNSDKNFVNTRVMGTYGYVAPEYANTGMLNEKSDIYSFGVLFLETFTGRDPVDYARPADEVNLVEWVKVMVASKKAEEVVDPKLEIRPTTRALKRALLVALRCLDPDADKRPKMSQVVQMIEAVQAASQEKDQSNRSRHKGMMDIESLEEI